MPLIMDAYPTIGSLILTQTDSDGVLWVTEDLTGWGAVKGTLAPVQKPRAAGAWAGVSYQGTRTMTLAGTVVAPSPALAAAAIDKLDSAVSLDATSLAVTETTITRYVWAYRDGDVMVKWLSDTAFKWSFQIVALDPRKFGTPTVSTTGLPSSTGGKTWPDQWPQTWPATTVTGQIALTNPGNAAGPVVLRIDGPVSGPVVTHRGATDRTIAFASSLTLAAGEWLTIDMDARTALANDQAPRSQYITSRGWSQFDPGANVWAFSATAYSAGALMTVTATPAWN